MVNLRIRISLIQQSNLENEMNNIKFWKWKNQVNNEDERAERILFLNGTISESSWLDDDLTPQMFKDELNSGDGDITVWIN